MKLIFFDKYRKHKKSKRQRRNAEQNRIEEILKRSNEAHRPGGTPADAEYR